MSIFLTQNPGIGGLDELTLSEEVTVQTIASLGSPGQVLRTNVAGDAVEWFSLSAGSGDVVGPSSAVNNDIAVFDGTTGKLIKDSGVLLSSKQDTLVSGTNIKTINSTSLLGAGDIVISGVSDGDKGDITVTGTGATWTIDNGVVTLAKQANVATGTVFYRKTAGTGAPEVQTLATLKTDLGLTGTNSGDQTSIVGITGTKAQFNTAVTDGDILFVGDVTSNATHTGDVTGSTSLTIDPTAITGKTAVTAVGTDYVLISDTSDSGNLKKALISDFASGGGNVTKVGTPADNQIGVWTGDGTIEGTTGLTYDGSTMEAVRVDTGTTGVILSLYQDSSTPATSDIVGIIQFNGRDSATNKQEYGRISVEIQSPTSTAEGGNMYFDLASAGTSVRQLELLRGTTLRPGTNDLLTLGSTGQAWSDLFLASGGAINWASSNATLTHSTGLLTSNVPLSLGTSNALTAGTIELGHASDTTISRSSAGVIAVEGVVIPSISSTNTFTNKRITKRVGTTTSSATPTINTDNYDMYTLTAQAVDITSFTTNLSGTPTDGQTLWISITGTAARAITWGASFEASTVALPTTTVTTARLDVGFVWNTVTSKWRVIAIA